MAYFPGDNLPFPEDQQEDVLEKIERFRGMSEAFVEDLLPFTKIYTMLEEAEQRALSTEVPEDYAWTTNTRNDILHWTYVGSRALQNLGAPVAVTHVQGDRDKKIVSPNHQVAHYGLPGNPSRFIITSLIHNNEQPGFKLLTQGIADRFLPSTDVFSSDSLLGYERIHGVDTLKEEGLLERHFLFSALRAGVLQLSGEPGRDGCLEDEDRKSLALYEKLRENEHRPLGPEEFYGIMTSAIINHMQRHPEEDFREKPDDRLVS